LLIHIFPPIYCRVLNPETLEEVDHDGKTMGEVMIKGNVVMRGYLNNPKASEESFSGGWFRTGDLAVSHGNGRIELKDRSKDIIISGGENISSIEVENTLLQHKEIAEAAVIAQPDEKWGEVPAAFVTLNQSTAASGIVVTPEEIIAWSRRHLAGFQAPKRVIILKELPKTSTGKVQKHVLRTML
jgi:fatty-acyl-CoA synthase